jgi:D-sedoheptulose 7-phosphate isomerase
VQPGDIIVRMTTSGNRKNVCAAMQVAHGLRAVTASFTDDAGGAAADISDIGFRVASSDTARIQAAHSVCGHMVGDWIEVFYWRAHPAAEGCPNG